VTELEDARRRQEEAAKRRFDEQAAHRQENIEALHHSGGLAEVNTPEELARRLDRVTRYFGGELPTSEAQVPAAAEQAPSAVRAGIVLEKIINTADFVGVRYLGEGVAASSAVCRIDIRDEAGRVVGYGTGSLVSPRLLLTNHHVLPSAQVARSSAAEFNYQDGLDGAPLQPQLLPLDPDTFFVNDQERDFALVAVAAREDDLAPYGLNRLIEAQGKALVGDFVTIVQHPRGEKKQVALRDNRIVDELEFFLHYEADTEPGSSGSPVFNDQWEVVALHHASVPTPEHGEGSFLNEGIRASRILQYLAEQQLAGPQQALRDQLREPERIVVGTSPEPSSGGDGQPLTWSVPLELTIQLRKGAASVQAAAPQPVAPGVTTEALVEPFRDEDSDRPGYDAKFLGIEVPVPTVVDKSLVSRLDDGSYVLLYEHFSIVMNKTRRLALFTASNVDASPQRKKPEAGRDYTRRGLTGLGPNDQEKWFTDPRIPAIHQLPDRFFTKDRASFDKGHIVRRDDVAWGDTFDELRRANGDTYHVTNCSPQVADFNRSNKKGVWGELENLVLKQAATERYCVLAGPIFRADDRIFHGVDDAGAIGIAIPRQFWKIVVARSGDALQTFAFLLDQDLSDTKFEFAVDKEWRTRMVSVGDLEKLVAAATFPKQLHKSDQFDAAGGEAIRAETGVETISV
jgi:endonuclease G